MVPPFEVKSFSDMNKKEAQEHFQWFTTEISKRISILTDTYISNGGRNDALNFSEESLFPLWEWFIPKVKMVDKTKTELKLELTNTVGWLNNYVMEQKVSFETQAVAADISIYLGEVVRRNNNAIEWGVVFKPKSFVSVNRPILLGFKNNMDMDTLMIITNLIRKIDRGDRNSDMLCNTYKVWQEYI